MLGYSLVQPPVLNVSPVFTQPDPCFSGTNAQILIGRSLADPQQVEEPTLILAVYSAIYWHHLPSAVEGDGLDHLIGSGGDERAGNTSGLMVIKIAMSFIYQNILSNVHFEYKGLSKLFNSVVARYKHKVG